MGEEEDSKAKKDEESGVCSPRAARHAAPAQGIPRLQDLRRLHQRRAKGCSRRAGALARWSTRPPRRVRRLTPVLRTRPCVRAFLLPRALHCVPA